MRLKSWPDGPATVNGGLLASDRAERTGKELRQQGIAVLASLALLDADHHALTLDVRDLEADDIAATPVCDGKPRAVALGNLTY